MKRLARLWPLARASTVRELRNELVAAKTELMFERANRRWTERQWKRCRESLEILRRFET